MTQAVENRVKNKIYGKGRGWCFTPKDFSDLGSSESIRKALSNLEQQDFIRRLSFGLYDYPRSHEELGPLQPEAKKVAEAIAKKYNIKIQSSGAYAANLLGLSKQVPAKIVYLTEGMAKKINIGKMEIIFKKTTPKNMKTADRISGLVIQALKFIGEDNVEEKMIRAIKKNITEKDQKRLSLDAKLAPAWISKIIKKDLVGENNG